jgi:glycosyltransferase involved in cell wall biosynthesis
MPSVSVVVPTYQRRERCRQAVASALDQTAPPVEVLVCDDGSTDGTQEEFERWAGEEPRLRYLRLERNHGTPGPARNLGVAQAQSDWVAFLDSDDRWLPKKLEAQSDALSSGRYDIVASDAERSGGGPYLGLTGEREPGWRDLLRENPLITSTAVVRRSVLQSAGGFSTRPRLGGVEDYAAWLELARAGARFLVLPQQLVAYDDAPSGISGSERRQETAVALIRWGWWLRRPYDAAALRSALSGTYFAARWALRPGRAGGRRAC